MSAVAYEAVGAEDRAWFLANPRRRYRLRPIVEAERKKLLATEASHIVVEKITSCVRLRRPVLIRGSVPDVDRVLQRMIREGVVVVPAEEAA